MWIATTNLNASMPELQQVSPGIWNIVPTSDELIGFYQSLPLNRKRQRSVTVVDVNPSPDASHQDAVEVPTEAAG